MKRQIKIHLEKGKESWDMDTDLFTENLVMFGFEKYDEEGKRIIADEQVLDVNDLKLIKLLIDQTLQELVGV